VEKEEEKSIAKLSKAYQEIGVYLGLGTQLAATITFMSYSGWWLDEYFDSKPIFLIIFAFLGGFAGIYNFIKATLKANEKKKSDK
jgi:F0F1-type ATP synthase assembly protein I